MHSYYSFDYVIKLPLNRVTRLLVKANDKKHENKAWQLYVSKYPHFTKEDFKLFEEYYNPKKQTSNKTEKEILDEVKEILNAFKKEGEM